MSAALHRAWPLLVLGLLACAGCGHSDPVDSDGLPPLPAPDGQGHPSPASGETRAGTSYDVTIAAPDGKNIVFTVHEPLEIVGGETYPLLLNGPGFGLPRTPPAQRDLAAPPGTPLADIGTTKQFTDEGYGVISFDQRGFGGSQGTVTVMDPDHDGPSLVAIVDWAQSNLDWLAYRGGELLLGAYGGSYGGGYQLLLNNVDPRHRLKAIVPGITWNDLAYSLGSGDVPKTGYGLALTALGEASSTAAGNDGMDPAVLQVLQDGLNLGRYTDADYAFLRYHGNAYFCNGDTQDGKRPARQPPKVDALFFQGMYDALFNLNEADANYRCLRNSGGDVRLFTYVVGHVLPAGGNLLPDGTTLPSDYYRCGPYVADAVSLQWFDAKLKRDPAAIEAVRTMPRQCLNLGTDGEGVSVNGVPVGGDDYPVPATTVTELAAVPVSVPLFTATGPTVVAGIPTARLTIANPAPSPDTPDGLPLGVSSEDAIVFVSLGVVRAGVVPAQLEIIDDQVRPMRSFGTQDVQLNGIGIKLETGDQLALVVAGQSLPQYPLVVARNPLLPAVTVSGSVQVPVLGDVPTLE